MPIGGLAGIYNPDNPNNFPPPDDGSGSPPPDTTNPPPAGGGSPDPSTYTAPDGSFDVNKFLSGVLNAAPGVGKGDISTALLIPAFGAAYKQWQDAQKYKDTATEAAKYGDPFGAANRNHYQEMLQNSYDHPDQVLNDPGHMATIQSGLNTVSRADASKGYLGSGNMEGDLAKYVANENAKYLDSYRAGLQPLTGSQFNPSAAGDFLMQGQTNEINSQNAALQSMFMPFLAKAAQNNINNNTKVDPGKTTTTTPGGGAPNLLNTPVDWSKYTTSPGDMQNEILKITGGVGGTAADIWKEILSGKYQNISPSTKMFIEDMAKDPTDAKVNLGDPSTYASSGTRTGFGGSIFGPPPPGGGGTPTQPGDDDPNGPIPDPEPDPEPPVDPENYGEALMKHFS